MPISTTRFRTAAIVAAVAVLPVTAVAQHTNLFGGFWHVEDQTSPVTGQRTVLVATTALQMVTRTGGMISLAIRCMPTRYRHELSVVVIVGRSMSVMPTRCIPYKTDADPPKEDCYGQIADQDRAVLLGEPTAFTKALVGKTKLLMEIPVRDRGKVVAEFTVTGIEKHLASLQPQCELR
jgi:hypothetical protein